MMRTGAPDGATTAAETTRRVGVAQTEAMYGSILLATCAASAASTVMAGGLAYLGFAKPWTAFAWGCVLNALALCNVVLWSLYRRARSRSVGDQWRVWVLR